MMLTGKSNSVVSVIVLLMKFSMWALNMQYICFANVVMDGS